MFIETTATRKQKKNMKIIINIANELFFQNLKF